MFDITKDIFILHFQEQLNPFISDQPAGGEERIGFEDLDTKSMGAEIIVLQVGDVHRKDPHIPGFRELFEIIPKVLHDLVMTFSGTVTIKGMRSLHG